MGTTATIMNLNLNTVDSMTMILLSQQRHAVFVRTGLKVMTMIVMTPIIQKKSAKTKTRMEKRIQKAMDVGPTLIILTCVVIWMMTTLTQDICAAVAAMIKSVEIKIGKERISMLQTLRVMVACITFRIMIRSLTVRFMMMKISLLRKCAAYMEGDAIIPKAYMIRTTMIVAIMRQIHTRVAHMTQNISSHQMLVVSARTDQKVMTPIVQKMSAITMKTTMER